jgi:CBS domain containing-hemolysin-like protein
LETDAFAVALCLVGSAFFSSSETALTSLPITRLEALRERSGRLTRAGLDRWANAPQELLITILVGNNLVNVLASALATRLAYHVSASSGLAFVVGLMTLFILIFGEITPKTLAQAHAQWLAARVAPVLYLLDIALRPINLILGLLTRALTRTPGEEPPVTEEDLLFMLRLAHRHAQLPREARVQIESVLRLQQTVAREVMVPRTMVTTVDSDWDLEMVRAAVADSPHSRLPVVKGSPDEIVGILHAKHLLRASEGSNWTEMIVPPVFIPETKALADLLQELRLAGLHMAVVLDEFCGVSGIVTLEDAIELVVGEIEDEFDREQGENITALEDSWSVSGVLSLRRLERIAGKALATPDGIDSVGGLLGWLLADGLSEGATVDWQGFSLKVLQIGNGRATRVLIKRVKSVDRSRRDAN